MESDYLISELLDDYKESDEEHKEQLVNEFINRLWKSNYTYKTYKKYHTFILNEDLLQNRIDLINLFSKYNIIEYLVCKSFYDKQLSPFDYIRIHINNMYGYLIDPDVYLPKEYYQLLLTPKREYFSVINKLKNGEKVNCHDIVNTITSSMSKAEGIMVKVINKKIVMAWKEYKNLINSYIIRLFNNYTPLHEYEEKHGWEMHVDVDGWSEENYIVKYFCKSLTGYLRNYVRDSKQKKIKKKHCLICENPIESPNNRSKYCQPCAKMVDKNKAKIRMRKIRSLKCSI